MAKDPEDEALSWGTESDPTHVDSPVVSSQHEDEQHDPGMSSSLLVILGVFGGVFLLFTVGWIIAVQRTPPPAASVFFAFMYQFGEVLAVAAPAAWFVAVLVVTRGRRTGVRLLWLLLGVLTLAPWPFILGRGA